MDKKCSRCCQAMPQDESFCVACGHHCPGDAAIRKIQLEQKFELRVAAAKAFNRLCTILWFKQRF